MMGGLRQLHLYLGLPGGSCAGPMNDAFRGLTSRRQKLRLEQQSWLLRRKFRPPAPDSRRLGLEKVNNCPG